MSAVVKNAKIVPVSDKRNPHQKFSATGGDSRNPSVRDKPPQSKVTYQVGPQLYNVEGEAVMRVLPPELEDKTLSKAIRLAEERVKLETENYKSWKASFASFCNDPGLLRLGKVEGKAKVQPINKVLVCSLLTAEEKKTIFGVGNWGNDTWGNHSLTAKVYLERLQRSQKERTTNTKDDGKPLYLVNCYPEDWSPWMSSQVPTEGYEERVRPPTVQELIVKALRGNQDWQQKNIVDRFCDVPNGAVAERVSKPVEKVTLPELTLPEAVNLNYGSPANESEEEDTEVSFVEEYTPLLGIRKFPSGKIESRTESLLGEFDTPQDTVRYLSWLKAPEAMRLSLWYENKNAAHVSTEVLLKFDEENPPCYKQWQDSWINLSDRDRLTMWLCERNAHNVRPNLISRLHLTKGMTNAERRMRILQHRLDTGQIVGPEKLAYAADALEVFTRIHERQVAHQLDPTPIQRLNTGKGLTVIAQSEPTEHMTRAQKLEAIRSLNAGERVGNKVITELREHLYPVMTPLEYRYILKADSYLDTLGITLANNSIKRLLSTTAPAEEGNKFTRFLKKLNPFKK